MTRIAGTLLALGIAVFPTPGGGIEKAQVIEVLNPGLGYGDIRDMIVASDGAVWFTYDYETLVRIDRSGQQSEVEMHAVSLTPGASGSIYAFGKPLGAAVTHIDAAGERLGRVHLLRTAILTAVDGRGRVWAAHVGNSSVEIVPTSGEPLWVDLGQDIRVGTIAPGFDERVWVLGKSLNFPYLVRIYEFHGTELVQSHLVPGSWGMTYDAPVIANPDGSLTYSTQIESRIGRRSALGEFVERPVQGALLGPLPPRWTRDEFGTTWFVGGSAERRLARFDYSSGDIAVYQLPRDVGAPISIVAPLNGEVWVGTSNGMILKLRNAPQNPELPAESVRSKVYATRLLTSEVVIADADSGRILREIDMSPFPYDALSIKSSPDQRKVYFSGAEILQEIDVSTDRISRTVYAPGPAYELDRAGNRAFVITHSGVFVIDLGRFEIEKVLPVFPWEDGTQIAPSPDGSVLYAIVGVGNGGQGEGRLIEVDVDHETIVEVPFDGPEAITVGPRGDYVFVVARTDDPGCICKATFMVDTATHEIARRLPARVLPFWFEADSIGWFGDYKVLTVVDLDKAEVLERVEFDVDVDRPSIVVREPDRWFLETSIFDPSDYSLVRHLSLDASGPVAVVNFGSQACVGDCDSDGIVEIGELVVGVRRVLGQLDSTVCREGFGDAVTTVGTMVRAVQGAIRGCDSGP